MENALTALPSHKPIHDQLALYKELMPWINRSRCFFLDQGHACSYFDDIKTNYVETSRQLYLRELIPFCSCAKVKTSRLDRPKACKTNVCVFF